MNLIKKISEKLSLTRTEAAVFLFLGAMLLLGSGYRYFVKSPKKQNPDIVSDNLLAAASNNEDESTNKKETNYKEEVLDLSGSDWGAEKILPEENSININTAGLEELSRLPGIGEKIAQNIMDFRSERGIVERLDDLIDVKGIGESKLNKIKKYLYIKQSN